MEPLVAPGAEEAAQPMASAELPRRQSGRTRRQFIQSPEAKQGELAHAAAKDVIVRKLSIRAAATAHGVLHHTLVMHYVSKLRDTDVAAELCRMHAEATAAPASAARASSPQAVEPPEEALCAVSPAVPIAASAPASALARPFALPPIPSEVRAQIRHTRQKWFARTAVKLVSENGLSYRKALKQVNDFYKHDVAAVPVKYSMVYNYHRAGPSYNPCVPGKKSYLPEGFEDKMIGWIRAMRSLNFPVFKSVVIGVANNLLTGTAHLQKFKAGRLGRGWYYRFLGRYSHIVDTDNARPLELDRAKWATAANVGPWYDMVAAELVKAQVAVPNPDYNPNAPRDSPCAIQVHITAPERIISFDETRVELDMAKTTTKAKKMRTLIDKSMPRAKQRDTVAQQGGLAGTGVGGSTASGKALPGLFILAAKTLAYSWCNPSPNCGFTDAEGKMLKSRLFANNKGGMEYELGVDYFRGTVLPCFPNLSAEKPLVVFCDGHGSHLTLSLLEFCRANNIVILLRVPHTSHLTQGEDLRNFAVFKSEFSMTKAAVLARNHMNGIRKLRSEDFMPMVKPAWDAAFTPENCSAGWRDSGLYPFTRKVVFDLAESEAASRSRCEESGEIDYSRLSFSAVYEGTLGAGGDADEDAEDVEEALVRKGRISSAELHRLGPVTGDTAFAIIKRRAAEKSAVERERDERRTMREQRVADGHAEAVRIADALTVDSKAAVDELKVHELKVLLRVKDARNWSAHKKLKGKAELTAALLALLPNLPEGEPQRARGRRRGRGGDVIGGDGGRGGRGRAVRQAGASVDDAEEEQEVSEKESDSTASDEYEVEALLAACRDGSSYRFLVHWEGYDSDEDSWEPQEMLQESASQLLEGFLRAQKDASAWPPTRTWAEVQA